MKIKSLQRVFSRKFSQKVYHSETKIESGNVYYKSDNEEYKLVKEPLSSLLGILGCCETKSIQFFAKSNNIDIIDIKINLEGSFDYSNFLGKDTTIPNTYKTIKAYINIKSSEKDLKKLDMIVNKGLEKCPVASTLKLAGVDINHNINYI